LSRIPEGFIEIGRDILENIAVSVTVNHIFAQVLYNSISAVLFNMIVQPSDKNLFNSKLMHEVIFLSFLSKHTDFRVSF
jgi:hypothetical protein